MVHFGDDSVQKETTILKPNVRNTNGKTVTFADDSEAEVVVVIFATGFQQEYPLSEELNLDFNKLPCIFPIYKHVVHPSRPELFFIGKAYAHIIPLMRLQAEFGCSVIKGEMKLPSKQQMLSDIAAFADKWIPELQRLHENGSSFAFGS